MKKIFLIGLMAVSGCLLSCGGNTKSETMTDSMVASSENSTSVAKEYKIENNKIIPQNGKPTIVDFSATWCPPCRQLKPIFERLEKEFKGRINFITVDVDDNPELSQSYQVQSIPMLIFLNKDGQIQNTIVGFQDYDQLLAAINTYFGF